MTTTFQDTARTDAAQALQTDWAGCKLAFIGWPGVNAACSRDKKKKMADSVGATKISASAPKIDTNHPAYKNLMAAKAELSNAWKNISLPWLEEGTRLIPHDRLTRLTETLDGLREKLDTARAAFINAYDELRNKAITANGELYNRAHYITDFTGMYTFSLDFPSLTPPDYLAGLNPTLYAEQSARVAARFDLAVEMAEQMFLIELSDMVTHLQEKLSGLADGTAKRFYQSEIDNLTEFFQRFRTLNLHSSEELDRVIDRAEAAVTGKGLAGLRRPLDADEVRNSTYVRNQLATQLSGVSAAIDGMKVTNKPRRAITRPTTTTDEPTTPGSLFD